ncbi:MAG: hypothetical protein J6T28_05320 [Paludibacteraceae bacterium]|nr:hypothetical protein [Paludibacteraceae bacterium]MBP5481779.1 hypothetical protein [Paludibacteraceae bacterium]
MLDPSEQINSKERYKFYKQADIVAYSVYPTFKGKLRALVMDFSYRYSRVLRRYEYVKNCKKGVLGRLELFFIVFIFRRLMFQTCYRVPPNVLAPGCCLHGLGPITINRGASIGENTRIHVGVHIGPKGGYANAAPKIGKNCYLGPGSKLFGDITLSDCTAVGANSVVTKSCEKSNVLLVGAPATVKREDLDVFSLIIPSTLIARLDPEERRAISRRPSLEVKKYLVEKGYLEEFKS